MTLFNRNLFFFLAGIITAFIAFLFLLQFQTITESESMKLPVVTKELTTTPTITPVATPVEETTGQPTVKSGGKIYYVSPGGSDGNDGFSQDAPFRTIQKAVDLAQSDESITLLPGVYLQDVVTKRSGTSGNPITISGTKEAIVKGGGKARVFEINHDYITLYGFTVDGQHGDPGKAKGYRDKLIYAQGKSTRKGVEGLKILYLNIKNAGGECIRLRYFAKNNEIAFNTINRCGVIDFSFDGGGKNGEGVYIGTAPEQLKDGKNPTQDRDESNNNRIHDNAIDTQGNECVDIKEGASGNIVENNKCTGQKDPESGGLDSRGNKNIFRNNEIYGNAGAGVRLGGDEDNDGINNDVYENVIKNNAAGGIKFQRLLQGKICGNKMEGNSGGNSVGSFGEKFKPISSC